jgi:hypothetical protein
MSVENSHGKARLTSPRVSDMADEPTSGEHQAPKHGRGNQNAKYRGTQESVRAPLKAAVGDEVRKALGGRVTPQESRLVAGNALQIAGDAQREVGVVSPFVSHHVTRFGVNAALAGFYTQAAAEAGFDTERGLAMMEAAHKCEARAERAMVAADAAAKAFAGKRPKAIDLGEALAEAAKPRGAP